MKRGFNPYDQNQQESSSSQPAQPSPNLPQNGFNPAMFQQFGTYPASNGTAMFQSGSNNTMNDNLIMSLFQIVEQQSRALQSLMTKVETITQRSAELNEKIKEIKDSSDPRRKIKNNNENDHQERVNPSKDSLKTGGDILEADSLIKILFGGDKIYQYKLQMPHKLELPLYRERNFYLDIALLDSQGKIIKNTNKIPLSLALYSSENPPKFIEKNTAGQKILKGYIEQSLHQGYCRFEKIQIKEVTSHFRNGWVFIVIIPSMTPLGSASPASEGFIDYTKIKPLVLEKVVVKAKKLKQARREDPQPSKEHSKGRLNGLEERQGQIGNVDSHNGESKSDMKIEEAYFQDQK